LSYTLIIAEKPSAAKSIAQALSDGPVKTHSREGEKAEYYEFVRDDKDFMVVPAVGHLFTLKQKGKGWEYPVFDVEWVPTFQVNHFAKFAEPYFRTLEELAKETKDVIIATDYDDEGEVIGNNILNFILGRKDASRMKFSTMTQEELLESYEKLEKLNKNLIESGLARHYLDFYWGISLTRALTLAIKASAKRFRILSTGRVQGPVLHMLAKHEKKIKAFKPKPFWEVNLDVIAGKQTLKAEYKIDKIWDKSDAEKLSKKIGAAATVKDLKTKLMTQRPPKPYNTTALLADIYRYFGYSPQQGMSIAESLYQAGLISYPRTSSEKLPKDINYKKIITALGKQTKYAKDTKLLLQKELKPEEGTKTDAAHPAIYPTGEAKKIGGKQQNVYDLIVRRFLACFGEPAKRESLKITLDASGEIFFLSGRKTIEPGWTAQFGKYSQREEILLPNMKPGDSLKIKKVNFNEKETQPPARFSQGSVLKEMENQGLGTKATRAQILQILYNRGYLLGKSIEVTELGMQLSDILEKNIPDVISEKLTRHFEEQTEEIENGKASKDVILKEAKERLNKICASFKQKEKKIGDELTSAVIATQDKQNILGTCKACSGTLKVHKNWRTGKRFVGCSGYKKGCRTGYPLPREGIITRTEKLCEECGTSIIQVRPAGRRPFRMCLDPQCKTKAEWLDEKKLKKAQEESRAASELAAKLKCEKCNKFFKTKRQMDSHMKTHAEPLPKVKKTKQGKIEKEIVK
jgi:DNA topoisomerase I